MTQNAQQLRWFPETKLYPPLIGNDHIERPRLLGTVHEAVTTRRLTLLSAPAGSGKTTLLASIGHAFPDLPLAWLSLDEGDNDPTKFLTVLLAALQQLHPTCGINTQTLLTSFPDPGADPRRLISVLINDILALQPDPFVLVLDDLHAVVGPVVCSLLDYLLDHLPPPLHVAAATRHDPPLALARLRARGQLAEFRLPDLRFTRDEAIALLNNRLELNLPGDDITTLQNRTEGWAAGLCLLAASLDRIAAPAERSAFITHLDQTTRYVFDFLAEEVLNRQDPGVRTFLLETAILPELTPALCRAVTGRENVETILDNLVRHNLFMVALAGDRRRRKEESDDVQHPGLRFGELSRAVAGPSSYRYHDLFAQFLRQRLVQEMPDRFVELHRRAAEAQTDPARAIRHYLAAEMWSEAARAVERAGKQLLHQGALDTVRDWIMALPKVVRDSRPWLICFLGAIAAQRGEYERAQPLLERALHSFETAGDPVGQGEALLLLGSIASGSHDVQRAAMLLERALAYPLPPERRAYALINRAWVGIYTGDWAQVDKEVTAAIQTAMESEDPAAFNALALHMHVPLVFAPSGIAPIEQYCNQVLAHFGEGVGPVQAGAYTLLGNIYTLQIKMDEAQQATERARQISQQLGGFVFIDVNLDFGILGHALVRADYNAFEQYWRSRLYRYEQLTGAREWLACFLYARGRALWLQNRLEEAREIYDRMVAVEQPQDIPENHVARATMHALLAIGDRHYAVAEESLRHAAELQQQARYSLMWGNARLLLAYLYLRWNRPEDALAELRPLLMEYERIGMPGLILIEGASMIPLLRLAVERGVHVPLASRLLDTLDSGGKIRPVAVPTTGETLTSREAEVLRLVMDGASNRVIAEQLVITERTVKSHITSILRKLEVTSRTQAAARARKLNLL